MNGIAPTGVAHRCYRSKLACSSIRRRRRSLSSDITQRSELLASDLYLWLNAIVAAAVQVLGGVRWASALFYPMRV